MKRQKKKYEKPSQPFSDQRIRKEVRLIGKYGLRNKKEVWKARTQISKYRHRVRELLGHSPDERREEAKAFLEKLYEIGLLPEDADLEEVLKLETRDLLERRLQTQVYRKGLAKSIWEARQLITHKHIVVESNGEKEKVVTSPSYLLERSEKVKIHPTSPLKQKKEE